MPTVLLALQALEAAGGAATAGYKLLQDIEGKSPGAPLTADVMKQVHAVDPLSHHLLIENGASFEREFG